jgi:phospholipase D1/2
MGVVKEQSIYDAYLHLIENAEHYIYIENQFFVSNAQDNNTSPVRNRIANALFQRILRAHRNGQRFRVFIVLPLLPAFENDVSDQDGATVRLIVHFQQTTLSKGDGSLFVQLQQEGIDPSEFVSVCSLRTHALLPSTEQSTDSSSNSHLRDRIVTEQLYIHSKLLIVDDRRVIIGSANINDRSMMGNRDSEIAVMIEDTDTVDTFMNGKPFSAARFAQSLRLSLFKEHLCISDDQLILDPLSDTFNEYWSHTALLNTSIYRDVFRCIPDDTVLTWSDYQQFVDTPFRPQPGHVASTESAEKIQKKLDKIRGNLVLYPFNFLSKESLGVVFPAKEFMISTDVFV